MKIKRGLAAFTAISLAVLIFGNSAHAGGPDFLGYPPNAPMVAQVTLLPSSSETPAEAPTILPPAKPLPLKKKVKLHKVLKPGAITTAAKITTPSQTQPIAAAGPIYRASSSGNTYAWGYCTWYAKSMRPDLPNNLGNGGQWVANAARQGFATGSTPRAGAIGEQPGHVVYVKSVNKNGTVNISEMNYNGGVGVVHHRTVPASMFRYIY